MYNIEYYMIRMVIIEPTVMSTALKFSMFCLLYQMRAVCVCSDCGAPNFQLWEQSRAVYNTIATIVNVVNANMLCDISIISRGTQKQIFYNI